MTQSAETASDAKLTDPSPKRKPGRPKGSKDKRPRKNPRRAAQQLARARSGLERAAQPSNRGRGFQVNARWPDEALDRLDAYADAHAFETRSEAVREAALIGVARWERLSRQKPPQKPERLAFWARVRLAWCVLSGKYSGAQTGAGWVLERALNTD